MARIKLKCNQAGAVDIATAKDEVTIRLAPEHKLTDRERCALEALYVPDRRQARRGVKPVLPRIVFREQQLCLGFGKREVPTLLRVINDLLNRLADRKRNAPKRPRQTVKRQPSGNIHD